ncbi:hypothetical protein GHT06_003570 [Daphnia sinensis]|uniref:Sulphur transport domain-containing protein n=1 Tax=Daphnia sinensis TaxID=1820382 RepID=A0AAD5PM22_9CRUS|nr:hypothetical protein GHT06_003570 [Daphnia sinensis]
MNQFMEWITQPWPWYVAGPIIGLTVPALLIIGNKSFGISSSLRHICAACVPAGIPFFTYNWRKEMWNLVFVVGILIGGFIASTFLANPNEIVIAEQTQQELAEIGITDFSGLLPADIFSWDNLLTGKGLLFFVFGGLLVGFGTRYAGGCTSGHAIMGISHCNGHLGRDNFLMVGGFLMTHVIMEPLMKLAGF